MSIIVLIYVLFINVESVLSQGKVYINSPPELAREFNGNYFIYN